MSHSSNNLGLRRVLQKITTFENAATAQTMLFWTARFPQKFCSKHWVSVVDQHSLKKSVSASESVSRVCKLFWHTFQAVLLEVSWITNLWILKIPANSWHLPSSLWDQKMLFYNCLNSSFLCRKVYRIQDFTFRYFTDATKPRYHPLYNFTKC